MAEPHTVLILALDTTTRGGSIAVVRDTELLALVPGDEARTHGERLPGEMAVALDRAGVPRTAIDLLAVATGPGAFTGLRIGLAAIQGLAMTLDRPVVGVSALDALVKEAGSQPAEFMAPWMDAQRGDVFAALHGSIESGFLSAEASAKAVSRTMIEPPIAANPATLLALWRPRLEGHTAVFVGDAVTRDRDLIVGAGGGHWSIRVPGPLAQAVAELGLTRARAGLAGPPHALTPIYVRRPDAEIERERRRGA
jgi:tRNA threonylcarbamoyladenosine biosynthesis protein TsaB